MPPELEPLARTLRSLRAEQGLEQLQLALAMHADEAYLSRLENGWRRNPGRDFLRRYIEAYAALGRPLSAAQRARLLDAAFGAAA